LICLYLRLLLYLLVNHSVLLADIPLLHVPLLVDLWLEEGCYGWCYRGGCFYFQVWPLVRFHLGSLLPRVGEIAKRINISRLAERNFVSRMAESIKISRIAERNFISRMAESIYLHRVAERTYLHGIAQCTYLNKIAKRVYLSRIAERI